VVRIGSVSQISETDFEGFSDPLILSASDRVESDIDEYNMYADEDDMNHDDMDKDDIDEGNIPDGDIPEDDMDEDDLPLPPLDREYLYYWIS
jgi:hypothetical protein